MAMYLKLDVLNSAVKAAEKANDAYTKEQYAGKFAEKKDDKGSVTRKALNYSEATVDGIRARVVEPNPNTKATVPSVYFAVMDILTGRSHDLPFSGKAGAKGLSLVVPEKEKK